MPDPGVTDPHLRSAEELRVSLAAGSLSSAELVTALLHRIESYDRTGAELHAVIALNPDALADAARLDAERAGGRTRGPLHGLPVLIKDNIDTAGPMGTTAGSLALADVPVAADATLVQRLRTAGAIVLGKSNLSEWANIRSAHSTSGWSAVGGLTLNPWALDRSAGGSSSGSGAAVAAGYAPLSIGTETDGSIICPAALCGVVGIKPTVGLVSRAGVVPISSSQDSPGPLARTVRDAAALLAAIAGPDEADAATSGAGALADLAEVCGPGALAGARIGVPRSALWGYNPAADAIAENALRTLAAAGATIVDAADIPTSKALEESSDELTVLMFELKSGLADYLAARPGGPTTIADVVAFNTAHADRELAYFGQDLFEKSADVGPLSDSGYLEALARNRRLAREDGIDAVLRAHDLDALVAPAFPPAWKIDLVNGDSVPGGCTQASAVAGYPVVTVPAGLARGLPVGLAFMGTAWSEPTLVRLAHGFEQARGPFASATFRAARVG